MQTNVIANEWTRWATCYTLSDFLQDSDFAEAFIDIVFEIIQATTIRASLIVGTTIYDYSRRESPHRRFAVRTIACGTDIEVILDLGRGEYECEALVVDLLVAFAGAQIEESVIEDLVEEDVPKCIYHEHGGLGGECYWVKRRWLYG
jgi:hypothetical protein